MKAVVLGGGRVGSAMALDLARDPKFHVTVADLHPRKPPRLDGHPDISYISQNLTDSRKIQAIVRDYDIVVNAVPGFMGFAVFRDVIDAGVNIVDIAFFPEDPFVLREAAVRNGVTALMDCGVAPGMSNLLVGYAASRMEEVDDIKVYVGGLPKVREGLYEYKAVFSPIDVIEEYTRPARYRRSGRMVVEPALTGRELIDVDEVGTLEDFNTDGLRTLLSTIDCPNMIEKTLRYPGHVEKIAVLRETGLFDRKPIEIDGQRIAPLDLTARLLFPLWEMKPGDDDVTVMRIVVEGRKAGKRCRYRYDLTDRFDTANGVTSMARTTGYTATMIARLLSEGLWNEPGVFAPEFLGRNAECVRFVLDGLKDRGIIYRESAADRPE